MFPPLLMNGFHHLQSLAQALHGLVQVNDGSAVSLTFQAYPFHVGMRPSHMMSNVDVCLHEVGQVGRNVHDVLLEKGALLKSLLEINLSKSISKTAIFTGGTLQGVPLEGPFLALFSQGNLTKVNEMRSFRGFRIFCG